MLVTCSNAELYAPLLRILTFMVHVQKGWPGRQSPTTPISPPTPRKSRQVFPTKADAGSTLILDQVQNPRGKVLRTPRNDPLNPSPALDPQRPTHRHRLSASREPFSTTNAWERYPNPFLKRLLREALPPPPPVPWNTLLEKMQHCPC